MDRLGGADGGAADAPGSLGGPEEPGEHVDAPVLQLHALGVLVPVDRVLVERLGHEPVGLLVHPGGDEGGEVEGGVAVERQLVVDELVGGVRIHRRLRAARSGDRLGEPPAGVGGRDRLVLVQLLQGDLGTQHGRTSRSGRSTVPSGPSGRGGVQAHGAPCRIIGHQVQQLDDGPGRGRGEAPAALGDPHPAAGESLAGPRGRSGPAGAAGRPSAGRMAGP